MQLGVWGSGEIDFGAALKSDIGGNILTILPRINWPNCLKWFLKIHNLTFNDAQIDFNDTQFL